MHKWQRQFQHVLDELLRVAPHTAGTYVKQAMASLGVGTRTEAALRAASPAEPIAKGS